MVLGIIVPFGYFLRGERSKKRYKRALGANVVFYFGAFAIAAIMLFSGDPVYVERQQQPLQMQLDLVISQPHCQPVFPVSVAVLP